MSAREQLNEMKKFRQLMEDIENDDLDDLGPAAKGKSKLVKDFADEQGWDVEDFPLAEGEERPYVCHHAKHGEYECSADSSYGAVKKAAIHWGMRSTAGVSATLTDVKQSTQFVGENDDEDGKAFIDGYEASLADNNPCMYCDGEDDDCEVCHGEDEMFEDEGHSIRDILNGDELTDLLRDLDKEGDIVYGASYFDKLYFHFLDTHADEIPVGSRTGRPDNVDEYVLDNLENDYGVELDAMINKELRGRGHLFAEGEGEQDDDDYCDNCAGGPYGKGIVDAGGQERDCPVCNNGPDILGEDFPAQGSEQECAWWAGCNNEATTTEPHPILGDVPICDRCVAMLRKMDEGMLDEECENCHTWDEDDQGVCPECFGQGERDEIDEDVTLCSKCGNDMNGKDAGDDKFSRMCGACNRKWAKANDELDEGMEEINLGSIVESILEEFPGQPKDYEMSDDEAEINNDFEKDSIDPEIEDEELGLRFD